MILASVRALIIEHFRPRQWGSCSELYSSGGLHIWGYFLWNILSCSLMPGTSYSQHWLQFLFLPFSFCSLASLPCTGLDHMPQEVLELIIWGCWLFGTLIQGQQPDKQVNFIVWHGIYIMMSVRLDIRTVLAYWFWVTLIHWTNSKLRASNSPHSTTDLSYVCGPIISNHSPVCPPWYQHWTASEGDEGGSSCPLPCAPKVAILQRLNAMCQAFR